MTIVDNIRFIIKFRISYFKYSVSLNYKQYNISIIITSCGEKSSFVVEREYNTIIASYAVIIFFFFFTSRINFYSVIISYHRTEALSTNNIYIYILYDIRIKYKFEIIKCRLVTAEIRWQQSWYYYHNIVCRTTTV